MARRFPGPDERVAGYSDSSGNVLLVAEYMGAPLRGIVFAFDEARGYEHEKSLLLKTAEEMPYYVTMYDTRTLPDLMANMRFPIVSELADGFGGGLPSLGRYRKWLGVDDGAAGGRG